MPIHLRRRSASSLSQSALSGASTICWSAVSSAHAGRTGALALAAGLAFSGAALDFSAAALGLSGVCAMAPPARERASTTSAARSITGPRCAFSASSGGVDRQVVGEELRIDFLQLRDALALLPAVDARRAARQDGEREHRVERACGP